MTRHKHPRRRKRPARARPGRRVLVPVLLLSVAGAGGGIAATGGGEESAKPEHREHRAERNSPATLSVERPAADSASRTSGHARDGFRDISKAPRATAGPRKGSKASTGTYTSECGRNEEGHHNSDNFIVAPGVRNGAHHLHDYVGNRSADAYSTDKSLQAAGTTCKAGDKSTYYWPVLRLTSPDESAGKGGSGGEAGQRAKDGGTGGGEGNVGKVLVPSRAKIQFRGNAGGPVEPMPRFLKIITGDAKAYTNGVKNARANWTCTGFLNRRLTDKYPRCPAGSKVVRILDFPSCWDGRNVDSGNHRSHIAFPGPDGICAPGTKAVPQLRITLDYKVPRGAPIALDTFPEQRHKPVTDHADFVNVMPEKLMKRVAACINRDRTCS